MADRPVQPDTDSTARWVKVFGIVVIVLVLLFIIRHLTGGSLGAHTPPDSGH